MIEHPSQYLGPPILQVLLLDLPGLVPLLVASCMDTLFLDDYYHIRNTLVVVNLDTSFVVVVVAIMSYIPYAPGLLKIATDSCYG